MLKPVPQPEYLDPQVAVSLARLPKKEAYLVAKQTFNGSAIDFKLKVETDLSRCRQLWQKFSPHKSLFDTWDFRHAFYLGYHEQPYFMTIIFKDEPVACLPLWYEDDNREFRWFGSWWQEDNTFFALHESLVPIMLKVLPKPTLLNAISCSPELANRFKFALDDPKYILHLTGLASADDFLTRFSKKRRYNLKRDRHKILDQNPKTIINRFADLKHLARLSMDRFHAKGEDSDWEDPGRVKTFEAVISEAKEYQPRMITTEINGQVAGVDLVAIYKGTYYLLKCGYDIANFPGLGNYTNLMQINDALRLGDIQKMDFLEISYGWKDKLLEEVPLYQYHHVA
ncbi:hypothetical protein COT65_00555 [Candidatus Shapirobacteria bacterium CG09_land_8_20_14_0_10_47_13]|uniref:BioF2-like acetyltransferase domain-containing protein n=1 Tax=Candidatus Shapirobacteria bacterium CG09_land_8_20_14_0_10_47_13 TaxID=1974481 RepID=A0A2H0WNE2_9BACT|nr:MAG: hypothetical protein COT65_00555 [Candidatus Shapirobacteria bacterium CG09_land_8_20_14_0_10_47_13]